MSLEEAIDELEQACLAYAACLYGIVSVERLPDYQKRRDDAREAVKALLNESA